MRTIGLSIDVDSVASHLRGYGIIDSNDVATVYERAIPRLLECLHAHRARATFFLIVEEASQFPSIVLEIVSAGHEVASHSWSHPLPLSLGAADVQRELLDSRRQLEAMTAAPVKGFRAPSWQWSNALCCALASAGYDYDTSKLSSWFTWLVRKFTGRTLPEEMLPNCASERSVTELAIAHVPLLGIPYYHSLRYVIPKPFWNLLRKGALLSRTAQYVLHAVDVLAITEDGIDDRLLRHPGMKLNLSAKVRLVEEELSALSRFGTLVPLRELLVAQDA